MRKEQAIVEIIPISKQGELRRFQVKVPMNAKAVIGVQTGIKMKLVPAPGPVFTFIIISPPPPVVYRPVVGELKLQSPEKPNIFYGTLVRDHYVNEDFSSIPSFPDFLDSNTTHGIKREMERFAIKSKTTVIKGLYKDYLGASMALDVQYEVYLAVWFEIQAKKK